MGWSVERYSDSSAHGRRSTFKETRIPCGRSQRFPEPVRTKLGYHRSSAVFKERFLGFDVANASLRSLEAYSRSSKINVTLAAGAVFWALSRPPKNPENMALLIYIQLLASASPNLLYL